MKTRTTVLLIITAVLVFRTEFEGFGAELYDSASAIDVVREAAKSGNASAQDEMARRLLDGTARSPQEVRLLEDGTNALRKIQRDAQNLLSSDTENAKRLQEAYKKEQERSQKLRSAIEDKEIKEAIDLLKAAVAQDYSESMAYLAYLYWEGKRVPQDWKQSFELNKKAANLGNVSAMSNLGWYYANGIGVKRDLNEAVKWLEKAPDSEISMLAIGWRKY